LRVVCQSIDDVVEGNQFADVAVLPFWHCESLAKAAPCRYFPISRAFVVSNRYVHFG
jgi:hypothetical protein